jgi:hypothetical protein
MKRLGRFGVALLAAWAGMVLSERAIPAAPVPVTACGQSVAGRGELVDDLDCSAFDGDAVVLRGRLVLNGFVLKGHPDHSVIRCPGQGCRVRGPGTVTGGGTGISASGNVSVDTNVLVFANFGDGVRAGGNVNVAKGSLIADNGGDGVHSDRSVTFRYGATSISNDGDGVRAGQRVRVLDGAVNFNGGDGLRGERVLLVRSQAVSNGENPACGVSIECADLASPAPPRIVPPAECHTSRNTEAGGTWGVCAAD